MFHPRRIWPAWLLLTLLSGIGPGSAPAAEPPRIRDLRIQQVGTTTYFRVGFEAPANLVIPQFQASWRGLPVGELVLTRQPQLVPQDERAQAVYPRVEVSNLEWFRRSGEVPAPRVPVAGVEFVGKCTGTGKARFLLLYPTLGKVKEDRPLVLRGDWAEVPVELSFDRAEKVRVPASAGKRKPSQSPGPDDLEGLWAEAQATRFAFLEALAPEFTFYGYAREATGRKYGVAAPSLRLDLPFRRAFQIEHQRLYETTTGAAAIAESLQTERLLTQNFRDSGERSIDIRKVAGIDIAEHPWQKMMGDRKPDAEPLARLVPHDNFYIHFKSIRKFIEMGELFDQWGTSLLRAYEIHSRDYQLKQRYERQLCLRSTVLGKTLGPLVIRGLAVTGSDGYVREGTDVTIIFHVVNRPLFLGAVNSFLREAQKEWGEQLREAREEYHKVAIESYVTPLREVSLHRATIGDFVIYSNSPAAVRRVIDTQQGRLKALSDSLDFQYMRTVFRKDDPEEDGFAFLSDPFIRQLVGPASKIKEKRRLEALTSLYMTTNDALFTAWETGKLPESHREVYVSIILKPEEIYTPDGKGVTWDAGRKMAISDVYGTLHFATPLVELPIDLITETERRDYQQFRDQYLGLWRRYFDPVGVRLSLTDRQVRLETYILPLIQTSQYNELRRRTGDGTIPLDVKGFSPKTIVQIMSHVSPNAPERGSLLDLLRAFDALGKARGLDWLGDWFMIRFDDSEVYGKLGRLMLQRELDPQVSNWAEEVEAVFQVSVTVGVGIKNSLVFAGVLTGLRGAVNNAAPDAVTWERLEPDYKGIGIVRVQAKPRGMIDQQLNRDRNGTFLPALYYAVIDGGWYISPREDCIKEVIDRALARREGKLPKPETVPVNTSLYVSPQAGKQTKEFAKFYLEWQTHRQALGNAPFWYALYRAGLVPENATEEVREKTALHYLSFVPVSAEGAPYVYERKTDEVINRRHGSLRRPELHSTLAEQAPLAQLLEQFQTTRADLRFREDGVNTVLTIERQRK